MPFFGDQFLWADVLRREGVAPGPPYMPLPLMGTRAGGRGYPLLSSVNTGFTGHLQVAGMEVDTMAWVLREVVKEQYRQRCVASVFRGSLISQYHSKSLPRDRSLTSMGYACSDEDVALAT